MVKEIIRDFEAALYAIKDKLQDLVANYLDVNREHIDICYLETNLVGEDVYDWTLNPDDACDDVWNETYYYFAYRYREDKKNLDYDMPLNMVWQHIEVEDSGRIFDRVMSEDYFNDLFWDKKRDKCSLLWYEEPEPNNKAKKRKENEE